MSQPTSQPTPPPELDADYYLRNFLLILDTVLERDAHLFTWIELDALMALKALPDMERRLFIRLFNRQGPYFRLSRLSYAELPDLPDIARRLARADFARLYSLPLDAASLDAPEPASPGVPDVASPDAFSSAGLEAPCFQPAAALAAFTVPELTPLARAHGLPTGARAVVLEGLRSLEPTVLATALLTLDTLLVLNHRPLLERIQRLFFLNDFQDATTLVTADLALVRYPRYRIRRTRPVFTDRAGFEAWLEAQTLQSRFYEASYAAATDEALRLGRQAYEAFLAHPPGPDDFLARYSARSVYARTALHFVSTIEAAAGREQSAAHYARLLEAGLPARHRGEAWVRLALHREKTAGAEAALEVCLQALADPATGPADRLALRKRQETLLARQERRIGKGKSGRKGAALRIDGALSETSPACGGGQARSDGPGSPPLRATGADPRTDADPTPPIREVVIRRPLVSSSLYQRIQFASPDGLARPVELLALEAYKSAGIDGLYTENVFFTTLMALLCWDILFADVPDVFQSPFQDAPLDLNTDAFYPQRRELIDARLAALREGELRWLTEHYHLHFGSSARGLAWEAYTLEDLTRGATCLGGRRLAGLLERLLIDYRRHRRGLPDLLLWRAGEPRDDCHLWWGEAGYTPPADVWFAEVKSPRDRLSAEQRAWMKSFGELEVAVEVCRVEDGG